MVSTTFRSSDDQVLIESWADGGSRFDSNHVSLLQIVSRQNFPKIALNRVPCLVVSYGKAVEARQEEKLCSCLFLLSWCVVVSRKGVCDENVFPCAGLEQAPMLAHRLLFMQRLLEGRGVSCFAIVR